MSKSIILIPMLLLLLVPSSLAASPFTMNIVSNTIYQNTNSTPLSIYTITHSAKLTGYRGNSTSLAKVIELNGGSITITGVVYSLAGYNMSAYMLVEPQEYYKFNFTNATFIGQYSQKPSNSIQSTYLVSTKTITVPHYSGIAQALFAAGSLLSIIMLLLVFRVLKFNVGIMGGIEGFAVGMVAALLIIYSLQFVSVAQVSPYTINTFNSTLSVGAQSVSTTPLAAQPVFAVVGYAFTFIDFILGFIYIFLAMLVFRNNRNRKKYS